MACRSDRARALEQLAAGELGRTASRELLDHIETCEPCSETLDLMAELVAASQSPASPLAPASTGPRAQARPVTSPRRWGWVAAAALVLAALGWWAFGGPSPSPSDALLELARVEALPLAVSQLRAVDPAGRGPGFDGALEHYAAGEYDQAARGLAEFTRARPDDALAHLYLGISLLLSGEPGPAREALAVAAREGRGLLRERALWYGAHAALELKDSATALGLLRQLEELDGDYRINAEAKRRELRAVLER